MSGSVTVKILISGNIKASDLKFSESIDLIEMYKFCLECISVKGQEFE